MPVTLYRWDDASAPVLNGTAGALIAVLDACLVNGYGSKAALGWTKEFSGTNVAAYRAAGGTRRWLDVVDTSTTSPLLRGYGAMTGLSTGTDPFPTVAQSSIGLYYYKGSAGTTARPWVLIGDGAGFYLIHSQVHTTAEGLQAASGSTSVSAMFFGDIASDLPGDQWQSALIAGANASPASSEFARLSAVSSGTSAAVSACFLARDYTQTGSALAAAKTSDGRSGALAMGTAGGAYPSPVHGGIDLAPVYLGEPSTRATRGRLPGLWNPQHNLPGVPMDTFTGKAGSGLAGRTFLLLPVVGNAAAGRCAIEISDTWR